MDTNKHSASLQRGTPGVLHGNRTYILQDENGQNTETHSVSAGLDYQGVGPEHALLKDIGRAEKAMALIHIRLLRRKAGCRSKLAPALSETK